MKKNLLAVLGYTLETWFFQLIVILLSFAVGGTAQEPVSAIPITGMVLLDILVTVTYVLAKMDLIVPSDVEMS